MRSNLIIFNFLLKSTHIHFNINAINKRNGFSSKFKISRVYRNTSEGYISGHVEGLFKIGAEFSTKLKEMD